MYGDTTAIRGLARALRERADEIRDEADRLVTCAETTAWQGLAADAMRRHTQERAAALRRTAGRHDDAAEALDHHAREVDRVKDLIAAIEHRARRLIDAAQDGLAGLAGLVPGTVADVLDRFVPPPPGSREWLTVDLPGLGR